MHTLDSEARELDLEINACPLQCNAKRVDNKRLNKQFIWRTETNQVPHQLGPLIGISI